jgi:hypothetical protein
VTVVYKRIKAIDAALAERFFKNVVDP